MAAKTTDGGVLLAIMRIVAGAAGGLTLRVPRSGARPTMDKVRAAIFSSLGERVIGAGVLDLFAGSGALGIEALSRGAAAACFVDNDGRAVDCIQSNLGHAKLEGARVVRMDCFDFLRRHHGPAFDLVFADPPYQRAGEVGDIARRLLKSPDLARCIAADGLFVLERAPDGPVAGWDCVRSRRYGATEVLFLARQGAAPPAGKEDP